MMIAQALVVFVGVAGHHHEAVEHQLSPVLDRAGVVEMAIPAPDLAQIARHSEASREIIKKLHVEGVIGGALIKAHGQETFRVVVYDGNGNMRSLGETPLSGRRSKLTSGDFEVLGINLTDEVGELSHGRNTERPQTMAKAPAPSRRSAPAASSDDDDAPPGLGGSSGHRADSRDAQLRGRHQAVRLPAPGLGEGRCQPRRG